ncbi:MAG: type II CAAX prenyl endopeptidase Rce1 family protein [Promethearchaeota archaeon]
MSYDENLIEKRIKDNLTFYSIIFFILLFWYFYTIIDNVYPLFLICFLISIIIVIKYLEERKYGLTLQKKLLFVLLFFIPFSLFTNIVLFYNTPFKYFISFDNLIGIRHNHNPLLILIYFTVIFLKLFGIKIFFSKSRTILEQEKIDDVFQFFTKDLTYKKVILLIILFPLVALIEELIYRSLLLSILIYYLNLDFFLSIIIVSVIFGSVHYSTSKNWSHVISTFVSSIIYSLALIQLGLLYPWIFHLMTNLSVLVFYSHEKKKNAPLEVSENNMN